MADTHALIWFLFADPDLSFEARNTLTAAAEQGDVIYVPSICLVEAIYLAEKRRIVWEVLDRIDFALRQPTPAIVIAPPDEKVATAVRGIDRDVVPDMPDRIIAATALVLGMPLITCDGRIRACGVPTIW